MKKAFMFIAVALIGIFTFSGCKKSSSGTAYPITASVFGRTETNSCEVSLTGTNFLLTTVSPLSISISIFNYTTAATYTIDQSTVTASFEKDNTGLLVDAKSGTITISSVTATTYVGNFSFVLTDGSAASGTFTAQKL